MRILLTVALLLAPLAAAAEHMDVIQFKLREKCSLQEYLRIVNDFNEQWGKNHGYRAEVAVPLQSQDIDSMFWVGRSASAQSFGKAWDTWRDEVTDAKSVAGKLQARFEKCSENVSRSGFDVY